jgi:ABC-type branched-subunit amino acid transport system permease subunit
MHANIQLLIFGAAAGTLYALLASGLIIIYRSSRVLNFAQGAIATVGAYSYLWLIHSQGWPKVPAIFGGILASVVIGVVFDYLFIRKLRHADPLARLVCTLGLLILITALIHPIFGNEDPVPVQLFPAKIWHLPFGHPNFIIGSDRVYLMLITIGIAVALWALYAFTRFGRATRAAADNDRASQLLGIAPVRLEVLNWALGSGLAGLAGILLSTLQQPSLNSYTQLLVTAIAIALVANFRSFGVLVIVGILLGSCSALLLRYSQTLSDHTGVPGWDQALPLVVIILAVVLAGRSVVPKGEDVRRGLPLARLPRRPLPWALGASGVGVLWYLFAPIGLVDPTSLSLITAIALMSLVVLTGYCGQISLGQMSLAALGALGAGRILEHVGLTPPLALIAGGLCAVPIGFLVGLPAVRVRGVNLAVVSLSTAIVLDSTVFSSEKLTGAAVGLKYPAATIFGINMNGLSHERAFGIFALLVTLVCGLFVLLVRRASLGARFLAVRANERGSAAQGLSVAQVKLLAFMVAAFLAGISGALMGYRSQQIAWTTFAFFTSITLVSVLYLGGVTSVGGAVLGGLLLANGGLMSHIFSYSGNAETIINVLSGLGVMSIVVVHPEGLAGIPRQIIEHFEKRKGYSSGGGAPAGEPAPASEAGAQRSSRETPRSQPALIEEAAR